MNTPLQQAAQALLELHLPTYLDTHVSQLRKALEAEQEKAVEPKPRDHVRDAGKMINERDELIDRLSFTAAESAALRPMCIAAIEMLEADAREIEATEKQVEILSDELSKCSKAQKVAVPTGWALVPIEPTPAILDAMSSSGWKTACYKAMLAAAQGVKP